MNFSAPGLAIAAAITASTASAATLTYDFVAETFDGAGTATGYFSYDTDAVDQDPGDPNLGVYTITFSVNVSGGPQDGGSQFTTGAELQVSDTRGFLIFPSTESVNPVHFLQMFGTNTGEVLPASLDTSVAFDLRMMDFELGVFDDQTNTQVGYRKVSLTLRDIAAVPLPAGGFLLLGAAGLLGVVGARKRRQKA